MTSQSLQSLHGLKPNCLSFGEVLALSFAAIAPMTIPASNIGLIVALAGNGTWLSFLIGLVGLVFVSININQFASRSAWPGSFYSYIVKGLGPTAGVICGWSLVLAYLCTGMAMLCGFAATNLWCSRVDGCRSDNVGIYVPLFAHCIWETLGLILAIFFILVGVWCYAAYQLTRLPVIAEALTRYSNQFVPYVLIGLGAMILWDSQTLADRGLIVIASLIGIGYLMRMGRMLPSQIQA